MSLLFLSDQQYPLLLSIFVQLQHKHNKENHMYLFQKYLQNAVQLIQKLSLHQYQSLQQNHLQILGSHYQHSDLVMLRSHHYH